MGIVAALLIIVLWGGHLLYLLFSYSVDFSSPLFYVHILVQAYLYTGLFITAHDSMHGSVSKNKTLNKWIGIIATFFFAGLSYKKLLHNHKKHHKAPTDSEDPDFYSGSTNFLIWWAVFMWRYITVFQLLIMAAVFNLLKFYTTEKAIWFYLVIPAFLSSMQLFFFGTFIPHKKPHSSRMLPHNSRTQHKNHIWAMLSCYFFGYHFEHHESPGTPWWRLYSLKK